MTWTFGASGFNGASWIWWHSWLWWHSSNVMAIFGMEYLKEDWSIRRSYMHRRCHQVTRCNSMALDVLSRHIEEVPCTWGSLSDNVSLNVTWCDVKTPRISVMYSGATKWKEVPLNEVWCSIGALLVPTKCFSRMKVPEAATWWIVIGLHLSWACGLMGLAY